MAASDQIRQMVNFILQEAHEKANEIRVKASGDNCLLLFFVFVSLLLLTCLFFLFLYCTVLYFCTYLDGA
jgi:hypothetical protein